MMPAIARPKHVVVEKRTEALREWAETAAINQRRAAATRRSASSPPAPPTMYAKEVLGDSASVPEAGHDQPPACEADPGFRRPGGHPLRHRGAGRRHRDPLPQASASTSSARSCFPAIGRVLPEAAWRKTYWARPRRPTPSPKPISRPSAGSLRRLSPPRTVLSS